MLMDEDAAGEEGRHDTPELPHHKSPLRCRFEERYGFLDGDDDQLAWCLLDDAEESRPTGTILEPRLPATPHKTRTPEEPRPSEQRTSGTILASTEEPRPAGILPATLEEARPPETGPPGTFLATAGEARSPERRASGTFLATPDELSSPERKTSGISVATAEESEPCTILAAPEESSSSDTFLATAIEPRPSETRNSDTFLAASEEPRSSETRTPFTFLATVGEPRPSGTRTPDIFVTTAEELRPSETRTPDLFLTTEGEPRPSETRTSDIFLAIAGEPRPSETRTSDIFLATEGEPRPSETRTPASFPATVEETRLSETRTPDIFLATAGEPITPGSFLATEEEPRTSEVFLAAAKPSETNTSAEETEGPRPHAATSQELSYEVSVNSDSVEPSADPEQCFIQFEINEPGGHSEDAWLPEHNDRPHFIRLQGATELDSSDEPAELRCSNRLQVPAEQRTSEASGSTADSSEEVDWSWVSAVDLRSSKPWLRASMRRVRHFRLPADGPAAQQHGGTLAPLATTDTVLDILADNRRPNSAPGGGSRPRRDFPRRYSSYSTSSVANLTQAAEPVAVESPSSEDEDEEEEDEEDVSSSTPEPATDSGADASGGRRGATCEPEMESISPLGTWPHNLSSMLASLGCTLGLFNISRFAILSIHFGANFIVQFLFLTLVMGVPLFTLHACLGQCLTAGVMDMWHISPIFQGIGIALLVSQALIGIYSIVGVSWMFIYFRDSFITKQDSYRWAEPYDPYREDNRAAMNMTGRLEETVPDYLNGIVLQRHNLATPESSFGHLKFQVAFNLAVVWMIVFVSLSKGLKSYGKVVYVFSLFPVFGMLVLCTKLLGLTPSSTVHQVFPQTVWGEFFLNTKCWVAATTEVFFTWGLLGAATMQITSHNRHKHLLHRDTSLVVVLTLAVLLLAAFLANTCVTILRSQGFVYIPSSFEHMSTYAFLHPEGEQLPPSLASTPVRYMTHTTLIAGNRVTVPGVDARQQSGYQVLRLATELVPSTLALLGAEAVSPFWAVLFYFVLILFGIAQQLCIWHCVITGIMAINASTLKSWETTITFFSCACGFILGLPMTTELGIFVVYFLDYTVGSAWWIMVLYLLQIIAVFVVRGRPYSGETVVATLFGRGTGCLQSWAAPLLVFTWNVVLPVALVVLCIVVFKNGHFRDLYNWRNLTYNYWPVWTREVGCMLQLLPIILVPLVCIVQSCRYLSDGPPDILDRLQMLYRPSMTHQDTTQTPNSPTNSATSVPPVTSTTSTTPAPETTVTSFEDPPPKYTPPPSYTTATGARIAKLLRRSFRRLAGALSDNSNTLPPPPDYAAVLVEINRTLQEQHDGPTTTQEPVAPTTAVVRTSTMTAADVAHVLRSSLRRTAQRNRDVERLVDGATPIHHDVGTPPTARTKCEGESTSVI